MNTAQTKAFKIFILIVFATLLSVSHCSAKVYKEKCGANATWRYNTKTKVLKISGKGTVAKTIAGKSKKSAWSEEKPLIVKKIIFAEGITSLDCPGELFGCVTSNIKRVKIQLPNSLESIGALSFDYWNADIIIPKNVKNIAPAAIRMDPVLTDCSLSVVSNNPNYCMIDGVIFSKDKKTLVYYPSNLQQEKYVVPGSVKKIAPLAFYSAALLKRVILPDKLKKLGSGAFYQCSNLEHVNLSDKMKIKSITDYDTSKLKGSWDTCSNGADIIAYHPDTSTAFGKRRVSENRAGTFEGTVIRSIHIPNSVKYLSSNTFFTDRENCAFTTLQKISFGAKFSGEINMGDSQSGMRTVTLNGGVNLKISIPKNNKKYCVQDGVLYSKDMTVLYYGSSYKGKTLTLPKTVKTIANGAFAVNTVTGKIRNIIIQGDIESIGYNAFVGSEIKTFTCNGKIDQMGKYAFSCCDALKTVNIQELKEIPDGAFSDCYSLKTVNCGTKVEKIGSLAFSSCTKLTKLTVGGQVHSVADNAFVDCAFQYAG